MKKEYKDLEMETVNFDTEDVITASGGCNPDKVCLRDGLPCQPVMVCPCNTIEVCEPLTCMDYYCAVFGKE